MSCNASPFCEGEKSLLSTAVSSEAWAKLREWVILAGKGRLLLSGSVVLASLKAAVVISNADRNLTLGSHLSRFYVILYIKTLWV